MLLTWTAPADMMNWIDVVTTAPYYYQVIRQSFMYNKWTGIARCLRVRSVLACANDRCVSIFCHRLMEIVFVGLSTHPADSRHEEWADYDRACSSSDTTVTDRLPCTDR